MTSAAIPTYSQQQQALRAGVEQGHITWKRTLGMLLFRTVFFAVFQGLAILLLWSVGSPDPLDASAAWWPVTVMLTGFANLGLLIWLFRREGRRYADIFRLNRASLKQDIGAFVLLMLLTGPVAFLPNLGLGTWLFGNMEEVLPLFIRPLPTWGMVLAVGVFPLVHALTELPTYFGYVMPRLEALTGKGWLAVLLPGLFLSFQHVFAPFVPDLRFIVWRGLMFLGFALFMGVAVRWKPRLMLLFVAVHYLMDLSLFLM